MTRKCHRGPIHTGGEECGQKRKEGAMEFKYSLRAVGARDSRTIITS